MLKLLIIIFDSSAFSGLSDKLSDKTIVSKFIDKMINTIQNFDISKIGNLKESVLDPSNAKIMKMNIFLLLNCAAFILNFTSTKLKLNYCKDKAKTFSKNPTKENANDLFDNEIKYNSNNYA